MYKRQFINDVDREGTTLQEFTRQNATLAKLYGVMYIVVDNVTEFGNSLADTLANRSMPYLTAVEPKNVMNFTFDDNGRLSVFTYATYLANADGTVKTHYHTWTPTSS